MKSTNKTIIKILGTILAFAMLIALFYFTGFFINGGANGERCGVTIQDGNGSSHSYYCSWWGENYIRFTVFGFIGIIVFLSVITVLILLIYGCYNLVDYLLSKKREKR